MDAAIFDLTDSAADRKRLAAFYGGLYLAGFPDPDERESLANMARYLGRKREGWYGRNNYHIALLYEAGEVIGASVSDYLTDANCGVIEFILVAEAVRGRGYGRRLHAVTRELLEADARRAGFATLDAIVIEMNDPFRVTAEQDNFDPFERAGLWGGWGYGRLCFPYAQPALSPEQNPVDCLILAAKPLVPALATAMPAGIVRRLLEGYLIWAMRIPEPEHDPTFRGMAAYLATVDRVPIQPLADYVAAGPPGGGLA